MNGENSVQPATERMFLRVKMESMTTMATGLAHDLNNLLAAILGNVTVLLRNMPKDSSSLNNATQIESSVLRAIELTNQILSFAGKAKFIEEEIDVNRLVRDLTNPPKLSSGSDVKIKRSFPKELPLITGDVRQIQQAVSSLLTNAIEAIQDGNGTVCVSTGIVDCEREYFLNTYLGDELPGGRYVFIEVSDTGCGIPSDITDRMFDPFFTTKLRGRGLGLSLVMGAVKAHDGAIEVKTEVGKGSTFRMLLPCMRYQQNSLL